MVRLELQLRDAAENSENNLKKERNSFVQVEPLEKNVGCGHEKSVNTYLKHHVFEVFLVFNQTYYFLR